MVRHTPIKYGNWLNTTHICSSKKHFYREYTVRKTRHDLATDSSKFSAKMYFQGDYVYYATLSPLPPLPTISGYYYVSLSVSLILLIPPLSPPSSYHCLTPPCLYLTRSHSASPPLFLSPCPLSPFLRNKLKNHATFTSSSKLYKLCNSTLLN